MNAEPTSAETTPGSGEHRGKTPARQRRRLLTRTACALAVGVVLCLAVPAAGAAPGRAAVTDTATFTFSGAASGTLHITAANTICSGSKPGARTAIFDTLGKLKGPKTVSWAMHVNTLSLGKFKVRSNSVPFVSVQYTTGSGLGPLWTSTSGSLTAGGTSSTFSGSLSIGFTSSKARGLHVSGSWKCHIV